MAIRKVSKIDSGFSAASMTDMVFLLLMFVLMGLTLVNPNALKLVLPQSTNLIKEKPYTTVSITPEGRYYVETVEVSFSQLESALREKLAGKENPMISLHADENVALKRIVPVMNIAKTNKYTLVLATRPE
ncbi:MAG: biopolymer transporter ExbD [Alistipes sp.]|jgi:biopolymer transport protein ExbD|nr:biopolymer transporter ExbD [Alistipes sp.]